MWWTALALNDINGYREHVALKFERIGLVCVFIIYIVSVLAIFIYESEKGSDPNAV